MSKLVIDDLTGFVENIIVAESTFSISGKTLIDNIGQANVGDVYDGTSFSKPTLTAQELQAEKDSFNAQVDAELLQADMKIIRALVEGDTALINAHKDSQTTKRLTKRT